MIQNVTHFGQRALCIASALMAMGTLTADAQFSINESFRDARTQNKIIMGGDPSTNQSAYLTAGVKNGDNRGEGWLRLTKAKTNQKGFAYIDEAFSSKTGVLVDFEYKAWHDVDDQGADGISVFLFDANVSNKDFRLGGFGGSLGYSTVTQNKNPRELQPGLTGGYVGIGLDEFGNYSTTLQGGPSGGQYSTPDNIGLRGKTVTENGKPANNTNRYLGGKKVPVGIDYPRKTKNRPDDDTYYRRVQIQLTPVGGKYNIKVKLASELNGEFVEYINTTLDDLPPSYLKLGFAASTGASVNYHEIRNLVITTPGGVRVDNSPVSSNAAVGQQIQFKVNTYNSSAMDLSRLILNSTFYDGNGNVIPTDQVRIDKVSFDNHRNYKNKVTDEHISRHRAAFTQTLKLSGTNSNEHGNDGTGTFTIYATVLKYPAGGIITNKVYLDPSESGIVDQDLTNNSADASINIDAPVDLSVSTSTEGSFKPGTKDNWLIFTVHNGGPNAVMRPTTVTETIPEGLQYTGKTGYIGNGWKVSKNGDKITAEYVGDPVDDGKDFPKLELPFSVSRYYQGDKINNKVVVENEMDADTSNNTDEIELVVKETSIDLSITASHTGNFIAGQSAQQLTLNVFNHGPEAATGITTVTDQLPEGFTFDGSGGDNYNGWTVSVNRRTVTATFEGTVQSGEAFPALIIPVTVDQQLANQTLTNQVTVENELDHLAENSANNHATDDIFIAPDISLEVSVTAFQGYRNGSANTLQWSTATETNNKGFYLQRSTDGGKTWTEITFKAGAGTSNQPQQYNFVDVQGASFAVALYRLIQEDLDGKTHLLDKIVNIKGAAQATLVLAPNPAHGSFKIQGLSNGDIIRVYTMSGQQVHQQKAAAATQTVNISKLAKGIYFVKVTKSTGISQTLKLIVD